MNTCIMNTCMFRFFDLHRNERIIAGFARRWQFIPDQLDSHESRHDGSLSNLTFQKQKYIINLSLSSNCHDCQRLKQWLTIALFSFFLNIFQDCIQPFGHEMLSCEWDCVVLMHDIVLPPASYITSWYQFTLLGEQGHFGISSLSRAIIHKVVSGIKPVTLWSLAVA